MAAVKGENDGFESKDYIKNEPGLDSQLDSLPDEDIYEDAGDLDFAEATQNLFLARVPVWLWKAWEGLGDDQEIQIGTVRVEGDLSKPKRMSLRLENTESQRPLPKEFNMNITNDSSTNTFLFTEKDFPGYKSRSRVRSKFGNGVGAGPFSQAEPRLPQDRFKNKDGKVDKGKRTSYYRKAIPKKTAFAGQVRTELTCLPVQNKDYYDYMDAQRRLEESITRGPKILTKNDGIHGGGILNPGALGNASFEGFIKAAVPTKTKGQEFKAARMPQNELMDLLFEKFKVYRYWPMKYLKAELQQPEAYLRQTLEKIAELVKSGPFAGRWRLRQGANFAAYGVEDTRSFDMAEEGERQKGMGLDGASDINDTDMSGDDNEAVKKESTAR